MTTFTITIGWTEADRANDYSPFSDGFRPGATQHTEDIDIEWDNPPLGTNALDRTVETLCDSVYAAFNQPRLMYPEGLAGQIARKVEEIPDRWEDADWPVDHWTLSVGDTVTVGEVTMACARLGWERVTQAPVL